MSDGALHGGRFRISFLLTGSGGVSLRAVLVVGGRHVTTSAVRRIRIRAPVAEPPSPSASPSPSAVQAAPPPAPVEPSPPAAATYWGAWIGPQFTGTPAPEDMTAVTAFEGLAKKPLSLLETFAG